MPRPRQNALFILDPEFLSHSYGRKQQSELEKLANFIAPPQTRETIASNPDLLKEVDVIFSGWVPPVMDSEFLEAAPNLKAVFYAAGSIHCFVTEALWERGIIVSSAYAANAQPVAEYTLGTILLSLKKFWSYQLQAKRGQGWGSPARPVPGAYRSTVALIGCGVIARKVIGLLEPFDLRCLVYDPYLTEVEAAALGVGLCSLDEAFAQADVVSLHAPLKPETREMIKGVHFLGMKRDATFINTARGPIVREKEMIMALRQRPDLTVVLDVFDQEPPTESSPLFEMPNVVMTPHIAGSQSAECKRMGSFMVEEFRHYLNGTPLQWAIIRELSERVA